MKGKEVRKTLDKHFFIDIEAKNFRGKGGPKNISKSGVKFFQPSAAELFGKKASSLTKSSPR